MRKIETRVRCIREFNSASNPEVDFGKLHELYDVYAIIPNGCYYVLKRLDGTLLGQPGEPNHLVNMERFGIVWTVEVKYTEARDG